MNFFLASLTLFVIFIAVRSLAVTIAFPKQFNFKQRLFMTLNIPKGIATAVVAFTLATYTITGIKLILDLILAFIIYSIVLSTIVTRFSKYFVKVEAIQEEKFKVKKIKHKPSK